MLLPFHSNPDFQASLPGLRRDQIVWGEGGGYFPKLQQNVLFFDYFLSYHLFGEG